MAPTYQINIFSIIEEREKFIEIKIKLIKDENLSYYEKKNIVLGELKTTNYYVEKENNNNVLKKAEDKNENENILLFKTSFAQNIDNNISILSESDTTNSTYDNSKSLGISQNTENIFPENQERKLNIVRGNFCIKNNLYDIVLNPNLYLPEKYKKGKKN